jgi:hemerythrin-like domain-containing protein
VTSAIAAESALPAQSGPIASLVLEHERLVEGLEAMEALLDRLDEAPALAAFLAHLEFIHDFCELLHFPFEDAVLELILEAGLTPTERRVVFVNLAQHQQIYVDAVAVLQLRCRSRCEPDGGSSADGPDVQLTAAAQTYVRGLRLHVAFEQRHLQPLLRRQVRACDQQRMESILEALLGTLAGKPLERLAVLDASSRAHAGVPGRRPDQSAR